MPSSLPSVAALALLGVGGVMLARQATAQPSSDGATGGSGAPGWLSGGLDTSLDLGFSFGDGWGGDWTNDTTTPTTGGDMSQPRGIRNNNPGNIEYTGTQWQGLADPPSDGRYMRFTAPEYGIRAMARVLDTYTGYGLNTVAGLIDRWAPTHENPTNAYAQHVADHLGVSPTQPINVLARRDELIEAMIYFENGQQPYSMATIRQGVSMA